MFQDPSISVDLCVMIDRFLEYMSYSVVHHLFKFSHPEFYTLFFRIDRAKELNAFFLTGEHSCDSFVWLESDIHQIFEYLSQMRSDVLYLLGLRKNFEQIIVGQEIESSKDSSLGFKIVSETTLYDFEILVSLFESFFKALSSARLQSIWLLLSSGDAGSPNFINVLELLIL